MMMEDRVSNSANNSNQKTRTCKLYFCTKSNKTNIFSKKSFFYQPPAVGVAAPPPPPPKALLALGLTKLEDKGTPKPEPRG